MKKFMMTVQFTELDGSIAVRTPPWTTKQTAEEDFHSFYAEVGKRNGISPLKIAILNSMEVDSDEKPKILPVSGEVPGAPGFFVAGLNSQPASRYVLYAPNGLPVGEVDSRFSKEEAKGQLSEVAKRLSEREGTRYSVSRPMVALVRELRDVLQVTDAL